MPTASNVCDAECHHTSLTVRVFAARYSSRETERRAATQGHGKGHKRSGLGHQRRNHVLKAHLRQAALAGLHERTRVPDSVARQVLCV